jgi:hypothetical protein
VRALLIAGSILLAGTGEPGRAAGLPRVDRAIQVPAVPPILRAASDLALNQPAGERFWCDRALRRLAELQVRAGDFAGALRSARGVGDRFTRQAALDHIAAALARAGYRDRATEVVRLIDPGWASPAGRHDAVELPWAEHLISAGRLREAATAVGGLKTPAAQRTGTLRLAAATAKAGEAAQANALFARAADAAAGLPGEWSRVVALAEVAEAERAAGAAGGTMRRLVRAADGLKDPRAAVAALRDGARLAARLGDRASAQDLSARAVVRCQGLTGSGRWEAAGAVAEAQAAAGLRDAAAVTAAAIPHDPRDFTTDGHRDQALRAVGLAWLAAGDPARAVTTARAVRAFTQYRDDVLAAVVAYHLGRSDVEAALATAGEFHNPSRRAAAVLRAATALARAGYPRLAADAAGQVRLTARSEVVAPLAPRVFALHRPDGWGFLYDAGDGFTVASFQAAVERGAEVAAAAMALDQALGGRPARLYAAAFDGDHSDVVEALARAHARTGDPSAAMAWARRIGSGDRVPVVGGEGVRSAVERRIYALIGVADGLLGRPPG